MDKTKLEQAFEAIGKTAPPHQRVILTFMNDRPDSHFYLREAIAAGNLGLWGYCIENIASAQAAFTEETEGAKLNLAMIEACLRTAATLRGYRSPV